MEAGSYIVKALRLDSTRDVMSTSSAQCLGQQMTVMSVGHKSTSMDAWSLVRFFLPHYLWNSLFLWPAPRSFAIQLCVNIHRALNCHMHQVFRHQWCTQQIVTLACMRYMLCLRIFAVFRVIEHFWALFCCSSFLLVHSADSKSWLLLRLFNENLKRGKFFFAVL